MSTHIGAKPGEIAERVLMPGDPLRAKWIAETYLEGATCYSTVRGMLGFTGRWNGVEVSVQGSGMGMPSASIYAHELINEYGVKTLIRVGSCGALSDRPAAAGRGGRDRVVHRLEHEPDALRRADRLRPGGRLRAAAYVGRGGRAARHRACTSGRSWRRTPSTPTGRTCTTRLADYGVLAVEMESAALYTIAARFKARALTVLTVSDHIKTGEKTTSEEREQTFSQMVEIALDTIIA